MHRQRRRRFVSLQGANLILWVVNNYFLQFKYWSCARLSVRVSACDGDNDLDVTQFMTFILSTLRVLNYKKGANHLAREFLCFVDGRSKLNEDISHNGKRTCSYRFGGSLECQRTPKPRGHTVK